MPYIKKEKRKKFDKIIEEIEKVNISDPGELNFLISNVCVYYLIQNEIKFKNLNDVRGVLGTVWSEIENRILKEYEHFKKSKNGDLKCYEIISKLLREK